jgi:hypothetical protein
MITCTHCCWSLLLVVVVVLLLVPAVAGACSEFQCWQCRQLCVVEQVSLG